MRGRIAGQGKWNGGRPKASPNKKGAFPVELPPIRCDQDLKEFYEQEAARAGVKLTAYLRQTLEEVKAQKNESSV